MAGVKRGVPNGARAAKSFLKRTKGFLTKIKLYQSAQEAVNRAERFSYRDRRVHASASSARQIQRIGASGAHSGNFLQPVDARAESCRRLRSTAKMLSDIAVKDAAGFLQLVEQAKAAGGKAKTKTKT